MLETLPTAAFAQSPVCHTIRRGESAEQAARRVTGNSQNAYREWFQLMNPSLKFVPKSQYNRIRPGWQACVVRPAIQRLSSNANHLEAPDASHVSEAANGSRVPEPLAVPAARASADDGPQPAAFDIIGRLEGIDLRMLWLGAAVLVSWFVWRIVDAYVTRRRTAAIVVQSFAHRFVDEFERPLVRYDVAERPMRSDLRFGARRGRFDILLAPGEGRRYPNLSDHKKNVEYDVARVMRVLADDSFVSRAPYTRSGWIVLPFQFTAEPRQSGVSCISSL
jgi:hypothetical protein